ncbi:uncharacterized protein LOC106093233 [Stomoxys calcitrans]|uniref:SAYSvFN domain-containing protein n=1 Tax=Stomoxys calcitrans TaxID=35570 RepID=A0A1I8P937_STOCA|nr:uncharacterized protein LOC106093233 [Stomoxys calcitrans]
MENIEDKLQAYRRRKRREETFQRFKDKVRGFLMPNQKSDDDKSAPIYVALSEPSELSSSADDSDKNEEILNDQCNDKIVAVDPTSDKKFKYLLRAVYLALWITVYIIAIELQFGIVYLMMSALLAIYLNTRTGPKKNNEISAYSVFNKDCISIDGTLKAEQFEREMGIR